MKSKLFAIDENTQEVIVSESPVGSKEIIFIERIPKEKNRVLFEHVEHLTSMAKSPDLDLQLFRKMDKLCQQTYKAYKTGTIN